jgi:hypothetical protein
MYLVLLVELDKIAVCKIPVVRLLSEIQAVEFRFLNFSQGVILLCLELTVQRKLCASLSTAFYGASEPESASTESGSYESALSQHCMSQQ